MILPIKILQTRQCQNSHKQQIESAKMLMSIEDFQEKIRHLEEQIMNSPKTEKDRSKNEKIQKHIKIQMALSDIIYNGSNSREASTKFNVPRTTLSSMLRTGKLEWKGMGRNSVIFTSEE